MNSLRIIANNVADTATSITSTNQLPTLPAKNLQLNRKALVWRTSTTTDTLTVSLAKSETITGVILPGCNFTNEALMRVKGYLGATLVYDSGQFVPCPPKTFDELNWGYEALGVNYYSYSEGLRYAYHWIPESAGPVVADRVEITVSDPNNPAGYLEASRLVIGEHWSPEVTADLGVQLEVSDKSSASRSESGDYVTKPGFRHKTLSFSLSALLPDEAAKLTAYLGRAGVRKPVFVSIYPEHSNPELEQAYQIYGMQPKTSASAIMAFNAYKHTLQLEEF